MEAHRHSGRAGCAAIGIRGLRGRCGVRLGRAGAARRLEQPRAAWAGSQGAWTRLGAECSGACPCDDLTRADPEGGWIHVTEESFGTEAVSRGSLAVLDCEPPSTAVLEGAAAGDLGLPDAGPHARAPHHQRFEETEQEAGPHLHRRPPAHDGLLRHATPEPGGLGVPERRGHEVLGVVSVDGIVSRGAAHGARRGQRCTCIAVVALVLQRLLHGCMV
mmetsp:Transcript_136788/g.381302  ORF Transcript_136788/g.381302 Transcript_136788/m.381302 type:complete len:218 (-) Transcript_136788:88-741(-)